MKNARRLLLPGCITAIYLVSFVALYAYQLTFLGEEFVVRLDDASRPAFESSNRLVSVLAFPIGLLLEGTHINLSTTAGTLIVIPSLVLNSIVMSLLIAAALRFGAKQLRGRPRLSWTLGIISAFLVVLGLSAYLCIVRPYRRMMATIAEVERGGRGTYVIEPRNLQWLDNLTGVDLSTGIGTMTEVQFHLKMSDIIVMSNAPEGWFDEWFERHFGHLTELQVLCVFGFPISDASIPVLQRFKNLRELDVRLTFITDEGVAELREALPQCKIIRDWHWPSEEQTQQRPTVEHNADRSPALTVVYDRFPP